MIFHFIPPGYLSWLERFRLDGAEIRNPRPDPGSLRFMQGPHCLVLLALQASRRTQSHQCRHDQRQRFAPE